MKIFTSYFYMIRFMKPWMIPLSTAIWDPKWFHEFKDQSHKFIDKNGVINGLRLEYLHPGPTCHNKCHGRPCKFNPESCEFLKLYETQIFELNKTNVYNDLNRISMYVINKFKLINEPELMLIVHEDPNNICSERSILQKYFNCKEWKNEI